jgi:hypothetical protein
MVLAHGISYCLINSTSWWGCQWKPYEVVSEEDAMSKRDAAKEFFDRLEKDETLQAKIKLGLETLTKIAADFDVTEEELAEELQRRWQASANPHMPYSEPAGF